VVIGKSTVSYAADNVSTNSILSCLSIVVKLPCFTCQYIPHPNVRKTCISLLIWFCISLEIPHPVDANKGSPSLKPVTCRQWRQLLQCNHRSKTTTREGGASNLMIKEHYQGQVAPGSFRLELAVSVAAMALTVMVLSAVAKTVMDWRVAALCYPPVRFAYEHEVVLHFQSAYNSRSP
jgi:hypothetical protein